MEWHSQINAFLSSLRLPSWMDHDVSVVVKTGAFMIEMRNLIIYTQTHDSPVFMFASLSAFVAVEEKRNKSRRCRSDDNDVETLFTAVDINWRARRRF